VTATAPAAAPAAGAELPLPDTPYRGLVPFREEDAAFFFGRRLEQELVEANLLATRLTVLYAESGVGKTSVLQAGAVRHLREVARSNLARRGTPKVIPVVFSSWRDDPVAGLKAAVRESVAAILGETSEPSRHDESLAATLEGWSTRTASDILVILDQFEEYFMYHPDGDAEDGFGRELAGAVNAPGLRVNFLLALREDALAKLDRFKSEIDSLFGNYLRLEHLDRAAAREAIEKPLEAYNERLPEGSRVGIEPELVEQVLDQVRAGQLTFERAGRGADDAVHDDRIEAPFLQLVMTRLWNEEKRAWGDSRGGRVIRAATLERLGGADRIVKTHLDSVMEAQLLAKERLTAARVFHYLVTPSGGKIAHRPSDLASYVRLPLPEVETVLAKLAGPDVRILRPVAPPPGRDEESRYEIFHDVLAGAVLDWRARQEKRQARRTLGVWITAFLLALVSVGLPTGFIVVAVQMRRVRPPFRWRQLGGVLLAMGGGWLAGVILGLILGSLLSPTPFGDEDTAIGLFYWMLSAILGTLAGFIRYSRYGRSRDD
jgi:hypothetical protein